MEEALAKARAIAAKLAGIFDLCLLHCFVIYPRILYHHLLGNVAAPSSVAAPQDSELGKRRWDDDLNKGSSGKLRFVV